MNLIIQHGNVRFSTALERLIADRLAALGARQRIEEAIVRLSDEREASPRYQASVTIRIPGPDIHATACDHTVRVTVQKALAAIERQVAARNGRRRQRVHTNLQQPATARTGRAW
jgi:ribosomal subunit interface protein